MTYGLLVIPSEPYAPVLTSGKPGILEALPIDRGVHVTARAFAAGGSPLAGVQLVLHNGALPSTLATSDATGAMDLWARSGTHAAYLVPPASSGLPRRRRRHRYRPRHRARRRRLLARSADDLECGHAGGADLERARPRRDVAGRAGAGSGRRRRRPPRPRRHAGRAARLAARPRSLTARGAADGEVVTSATGAADLSVAAARRL